MILRRLGSAILLAFQVTVAVAGVSGRSNSFRTPAITLLRTPREGYQPHTVLDRDGVLHMIYFRGDASAGDIEYVSRKLDQKDFGPPIRVNSEPGDAVAIGTVRGPQLSLGRNGRIYVIWFGARAHSGDPSNAMPVLFSRLNDSHTAFEPQQSLMRYAKSGDGGLSVAADGQGNVYAVWHAMGSEPGEDHRRVYLARSSDDGETFAREVPVSPAELGACGCCGMRAFADDRGTLYVLYRAAKQNIHRDITLLVSTNRGETFSSKTLSPWELNACPMSTGSLSEGGNRVLAAWETSGQIFFNLINPVTFESSVPIAAPGDSDKRKHPAAARTAKGQVLLVWTEGTGWAKGGTLAWQLFESDGKPLGSEGRAPGVPVWGLPSVFADQNGNFTIVY